MNKDRSKNHFDHNLYSEPSIGTASISYSSEVWPGSHTAPPIRPMTSTSPMRETDQTSSDSSLLYEKSG